MISGMETMPQGSCRMPVTRILRSKSSSNPGLTTDNQMQGVIIQQDNNNYIRFDFESDGANTKTFAATFANGVATSKINGNINSSPSPVPLYMRVKRTGRPVDDELFIRWFELDFRLQFRIYIEGNISRALCR